MIASAIEAGAFLFASILDPDIYHLRI